MKLFVLVGIGGALGSMFRYAISGLLNGPIPAQGLPLGTLFVNLLGCFFIGLLATILTGDDLSTGHAYAFLIIGILGGFTTFSSFGLEAQSLMVAGRWSSAALYVTLSNLGGLVAAYVGYALADLL